MHSKLWQEDRFLATTDLKFHCVRNILTPAGLDAAIPYWSNSSPCCQVGGIPQMAVVRYFFGLPSLFYMLTTHNWLRVCFGSSHEAHHSIKTSQTHIHISVPHLVKLERIRLTKSETETANHSSVHWLGAWR